MGLVMFVHRDARTGRYVTREFAEAHPKFTVTEEVDHQSLADAVREFLDEMYEADESGERLGWPEKLAAMTGWESPE